MDETELLLPLPRAGVLLQGADAAEHVAFSGLSLPEEHGRWTDGGRVRLAFRLPGRPEGGVVLRLESLGYVARGFVNEQRAVMLVNGVRLAEWVVSDTVMRTRSLVVPAEVIGEDGRVALEMRISTCIQPRLLGQGDDARFLGLMLRRLSWEERTLRRPPELSGERERAVGRESRKSFAAKIDSGFWARFITGPAVLDIGFQGGAAPGSVVPIMPGAIGVELDYPGYDGRILPFADGSQDAVYSSHCLEHIPDSIKAIQEWHRVLKVGGHIITAVPSAHLYERKRRVPSYWNWDHRRTYTPAGLLAEFEAALAPNSYRVRHLAENDAGYQYDLPPNVHPEGCYEIELVVEKIAPPGWPLGD
jgi:SAM-dependent methyltransferase